MSELFSRDNIKKVKKLLGWVFLVAPIAFLFYSLTSLIGPNQKMVQIYFQTAGGKGWLIASYMLAVPWLIDWVTDKNTIQTIMAIDEESHPLKVLSATLFLLGYAVTIGLALSGLGG